MCKEYGGYIELDRNYGQEYHNSAIALNCGRAALAYLFQARNIQKIYIPYFLCDSISNTCQRYGISYSFYRIDESFHPVFEGQLGENEWLYMVNYYGQLKNSEIEQYKCRYGNIIVDNIQAFFQEPVPGVDTCYTCRKFFGVPDGGYLYTDGAPIHLEQDISFERMHFLLGRFEKSASEFYPEYVQNNDLFYNEPVKAMSALTHNLMRGLDYSRISHVRKDNFTKLHKILHSVNKLSLQIPEGPFMYPLWIEDGLRIRKELQKIKIYIPTLWPDVFEICEPGDLEYELAQNILPLPVDQRYDAEDMEYIGKKILELGV